MNSLGPLNDGGRVIIIGGGPSGVACALALQKLGNESGRHLSITIVESKEFSGERHYNTCSGVVSPPLAELLENGLGLPFPYHLARSRISGYVLHTNRAEIQLDDPDRSCIALRRIQFDAYMLDAAQQRGITVEPARAMDMEFHDDRVIVYTDGVPVEGDVVVGAFGMDEGTAALLARHTAYRSPWALSAVVTKYHPGLEAMTEFGPYIHAFLPGDARIEFGAVTPKGNHLTINIGGLSVDSDIMASFLNYPAVSGVLKGMEFARRTDANDLRFYKGRFPNSQAENYYGDRFVIVGDAAGLVRAFKGKGITSGVSTGIRAARTMIEHGISRAAFHEHYRAANQDITGDLSYGRFVRLLAINMGRIGWMDAVICAAQNDERLQCALYDAVSAVGPYKDVLKNAINPTSVLGVLKHLFTRRA